MKEDNINNQAYTNRELYLIIQSNHEEVMREVGFIKEQTTKTNGTVKVARAELDDIKLWRAELKGKTYTIPLFVAAIVSGIVGLLFKELF